MPRDSCLIIFYANTLICTFFNRSGTIFTLPYPLNTFPSAVIRAFLQWQTRPCHAETKGTSVKLIIATIKPFKLEDVREALTAIGVRGMMVTEIKGFGSQSGHTEIYRGAEYAVNFVPKIKLEIAVAASMADQVVETIASTARTGKIGDGKIFVLDVQQAMRVRTGETNDDAL